MIRVVEQTSPFPLGPLSVWFICQPPLSSGFNPEPAVNLPHGMFRSRLKTYLFSKSFPP